ncbi:MAG: hypothetical protein AAGA68_25385 [Pseudomonadota bacterium]
MRKTLLASLACLISAAVVANTGAEDDTPEPKAKAEATQANTSPVAEDVAAESASRSAWATLVEKVPDLGGVDQSTSAQEIPEAATVVAERRYCIDVTRIGTRLRKRICYSKDEWLAEQRDNRSMREAVFFHGMNH